MWPFGKPSPGKFARMFARRMEQGGHPKGLEYDRDDFSLKYGSKIHYLGNVYGEYCLVPWRQRPAVLRKIVRSFLAPAPDLPESLDDARANLLPKVRERFFHDALELRGRSQGWETVKVDYRVFAEHLAVDVVYDSPDSVRTIAPEDRDNWDLGFDEALAIARDNLWRISNEPFAELAPGTYASTWEDTHDATRMLLHDLVWQLDVKGSHVAMVPDRNVLLVTGSDDADGLRRVAAGARGILERSARPLSGIAFILDSDTWRPFLPQAGAPAYQELGALAAEYIGTMYHEQQGLLNAIHEREKVDIFVATYALLRDENTQQVRSWCTWTRSVDSLLPQTHMVGLVDTARSEQERLLGLAEWPHLASVVGAMLQPCPDTYPPRYRVNEFPSPEQLARIELTPL